MQSSEEEGSRAVTVAPVWFLGGWNTGSMKWLTVVFEEQVFRRIARVERDE